MMKARLDVMLTERGLAESREKAQALVLAGEVLVKPQSQGKVFRPAPLSRSCNAHSTWVAAG